MKMKSTPDGTRVLVVPHVEADGITTNHEVSLDTVVHMTELLGYTNLIDTVEAIVRIREDRTDTPSNPETGENAWTEIFTALGDREAAREDAAVHHKMVEPAKDFRSPRLVSAFAARTATMAPLEAEKDNDSLLAIVQAAAREKLHAPTPDRPPSVVRPRTLNCDPKTSCKPDGDNRLSAEDREALHQALGPHMSQVPTVQVAFLHGLSGEAINPLQDAEIPEPPDPSRHELRITDVANRYRKGGR